MCPLAIASVTPYRPLQPPACTVETSGATDCDAAAIDYGVAWARDWHGVRATRGDWIELQDATLQPVHFKLVIDYHWIGGGTSRETQNCAGACKMTIGSSSQALGVDVLYTPYAFTAGEVAEYPSAGWATSGRIIVS